MELDRAYTNTDYVRYALGMEYKTFGKTWVLDIVLAIMWLMAAIVWRDNIWITSFAGICLFWRVIQAVRGYRNEYK